MFVIFAVHVVGSSDMLIPGFKNGIEVSQITENNDPSVCVLHCVGTGAAIHHSERPETGNFLRSPSLYAVNSQAFFIVNAEPTLEIKVGTKVGIQAEN